MLSIHILIILSDTTYLHMEEIHEPLILLQKYHLILQYYYTITIQWLSIIFNMFIVACYLSITILIFLINPINFIKIISLHLYKIKKMPLNLILYFIILISFITVLININLFVLYFTLIPSLLILDSYIT